MSVILITGNKVCYVVSQQSVNDGVQLESSSYNLEQVHCHKIGARVQGTVAWVPALGYEEHWHTQLEFLGTEYKDVVIKHPDAKDVIRKVQDILNDISRLAGCTPKKIGECDDWQNIVRRAEADRVSLSRVLEVKTLFGALCGLYSLTLTDLKYLLQNGAAKKGKPAAVNTITTTITDTAAPTPALNEGDFPEQKRRKRKNSTEGHRPDSARKQGATI